MTVSPTGRAWAGPGPANRNLVSARMRKNYRSDGGSGVSRGRTKPGAVHRAILAPPLSFNMPATRRLVIGISGASGAAYALRVLEQLLLGGHEVHLVASDYGKRLLFEEAGIRR